MTDFARRFRATRPSTTGGLFETDEFSLCGKASLRFCLMELWFRSEARRLPSVLIIGVRKGGTRALLDAMALHPNIRVVRKEAHFFDLNYSRGIEWYRSIMPLSTPDQVSAFLEVLEGILRRYLSLMWPTWGSGTRWPTTANQNIDRSRGSQLGHRPCTHVNSMRIVSLVRPSRHVGHIHDHYFEVVLVPRSFSSHSAYVISQCCDWLVHNLGRCDWLAYPSSLCRPH